MVIGPYGETGRFPQPPGPAARSEAAAPADGRTGWESEQGSSPKGPATPDNPSVSLRLTAPFTQGSLWGRGNGLPRRFAPRNDSPDPLSFRGGPTGRRGNPSFLRWTGVRAAVPRTWPPPTKFRNEIGGVGQVVGPYGSSAGSTQQRRAGRSPPPTFPVTNSGNRGMLRADRTLGGAYAAADAGL